MTIQETTPKTSTGHAKTLALNLLMAALMSAAGLMLASGPAHADTTFTVNGTGDSADTNLNDGLCDSSTLAGTQCTLRAAIQEANDTPEPDTIEFGIPGGFVKTIFPTSQLPTITEPVTIDGYSQPGSLSNTLEQGTNAVLNVQLDGSSAGRFNDGLRLDNGASGSIVKGLAINNFEGNGIEIASVVEGVRVEGNFIGTSASGTLDLGNGSSGVDVNGDSNTVGGTSRFQRNLISGNVEGVRLDSGTSNEVRGNLIGTARDGVSPLGNTDEGVDVFGGSDNFIGDFSSSDTNTIAFNGQEGVEIRFGTDSGVSVSENRILGNSIFSNGGLGIDLQGGTENAEGATANDPRDADSGPNDLQNKPVITSAVTSGSTTTIKGKLNSTPTDPFFIEFFSNPSANEGQKLVDETTASTDSSGNATFTLTTSSQPVAVGETLTATALNVTQGNTSEFSTPKTVVPADTSAPRVVRVVPAEDATGVAAASNANAFFSEEMRSGTVNANTLKLRKAGESQFLPARVSYEAATDKAILDPEANLQAGAVYIATVTSGAKDLAGNGLDQDPNAAGNQQKVWKFKVRQ